MHELFEIFWNNKTRPHQINWPSLLLGSALLVTRTRISEAGASPIVGRDADVSGAGWPVPDESPPRATAIWWPGYHHYLCSNAGHSC